jgi:beta-glucuronidase
MNPTDFHLISNVRGRAPRSLSGDWHVIVDPYENGYYDYRYQPAADHYGLNRKSTGSADRVEYNFDESPTLKVPGDWNSQRAELSLYEGTVWYKTSFHAKRSDSERVFLRFGAANYEAIVYLNGERLGAHTGGFTEFEFEATDALIDGDNVLIVKVDDQRRRDGVPTVNTDWYNFGGLTRDVLVVTTPRTFIKDYFVQLAPDDDGALAGWVQLDGPDAGGHAVQLSIADLGVELSVTTDAAGRASLRCPVGAGTLTRWSPQTPKRYSVTLSIAGDTASDSIGFRTLTTRGADILLNGESIFLRGISIHEQAPERPGRAHSEEDARKLLGWAKELGVNFVRLAHYPHNEHMVRVAEELGIMVWSEVPVYWTILWDNPPTFDNAQQQLTEMINRDKNRAAVILWSVGNETPVSDSRNHFLRRLIQTARSLDPTRLLTAALENHYSDPTTVVLDDPLGADLDVLGVNQYIGWYDGLPEKADTVTWEVAYEKPLMFSELGGGAKAGHHGDASERWTEEFQKAVYEHQLVMLKRIGVWRGMTPWILADFQSPRRPMPKIQEGWNRKGLVSDHGEKKQAFFALQAFYREIAENPAASRE